MKIFREDHFFDKEMINILEEQRNMVDNAICEEIANIGLEIKAPKIILNKHKVKKWLILCAQLENIEHSELIDLATKKKIKELEEENYKLKLEFDRFSIKNAFAFHRCSEDVQEAVKENTKQIVEKIREKSRKKCRLKPNGCGGYKEIKVLAVDEEDLDDLLKEYEGENK